MIIDLEKYLFIGSAEHLDTFFKRAQSKGFIQFLSQDGAKKSDLPSHMQEVVQALKILSSQQEVSQWEGGGSLEFAEEIARQVINADRELNRLLEDKRLLDIEIARVAPFGTFSMADLLDVEESTGRKFHFFCMKTAVAHKSSFDPNVFYISTEYDLDYFISFTQAPVQMEGIIEMRVDESVNKLKDQRETICEGISREQQTIATLAKYDTLLREICVDEIDLHNLKFAKEQIKKPLDAALFAAIGWVPRNKLHLLKSLVSEMSVHLEPVAIEDEDRVPTCMENRGFARIGEDLAVVYDIPATTDKDPSIWIFWAFLLFFSIIISDGGYGLLFIALSLFLKHQFVDMKKAGRRMVKLLGALGVGALVWGLLTASFFGIGIKPTSFISRISPTSYLIAKKADYHIAQKDDVYKFWIKTFPELKNETDGRKFLQSAVVKREGKDVYLIYSEFYQNILLEFCLFLGVIHITCSFLRYLRRNLAGIGWIATMFGGYLYFPHMLKATSMVHFLGIMGKQNAFSSGLQLLYIGLCTAPLIALLQKGWRGWSEIMRLIEVFSDVLSYLRLYALAIAGGLMAETFNAMGQEVGLVFGILVIIAGHTINISLSVMGGVIHGLRLNFLEWYHYSFDGGGTLFQPLRKLRDESSK